MADDTMQAKRAILAKVQDIARQIGNDAGKLRFDQDIPASGVLDSAGLMELMIWFEMEYGIAIPQEDLTLANFGTIDTMYGYLARSGSGGA